MKRLARHIRGCLWLVFPVLMLSGGKKHSKSTIYDREVKHDAEVKHQYLLFLQLNTTYKYVDIETRTGPHIYRLGLRVPWGAADDGPGVGQL